MYRLQCVYERTKQRKRLKRVCSTQEAKETKQHEKPIKQEESKVKAEIIGKMKQMCSINPQTLVLQIPSWADPGRKGPADKVGMRQDTYGQRFPLTHRGKDLCNADFHLHRNTASQRFMGYSAEPAQHV